MEKKQNYVTCIQKALQHTQRQENIHLDVAKDVEKRFHTSNYELHRPLSKYENKKSNVINER